METFSLMNDYCGEYEFRGDTTVGQIYHIVRNEFGGSILTPVGRWFAWQASGDVECFHDRWRVDCFVRDHSLAPEPMPIGEALVSHLMREKICSEPLWLSVHRSDELDGKPYGNVYQDD